MSPECAICGDAGTRLNAVQPMSLIEPGTSAGQEPQIHLCESCADLRTTRTWNARGADGRRIVTAWRNHEHPKGHYAYLLEQDATLHLMRLREDWVEGHAERAA